MLEGWIMIYDHPSTNWASVECDFHHKYTVLITVVNDAVGVAEIGYAEILEAAP